MGKNKVKIWCDEDADILYISFKKGVAIDSEETEEGVRVEYGPAGEIVGLEISGVSRFMAPAIIKKIEGSIPKTLRVK